jgi:predicted enzyme related to lactoylglutathione lyase
MPPFGRDQGRDVVVAGIGRLTLVQVDCHDPLTLARFWSLVLGVEIEDVLGDPPHYVNLAVPGGGPDGTGVAFQRVPERKSVKNRLHFDIWVDDVESATAGIEALGGSRGPTEDVSEYGYHWRVMGDPDGNEFCLIFSL